MWFYILKTMSCTFQSAFQRQLFIKTFSGTYYQEDVTTDVQSVKGREQHCYVHNLRAVTY